MLKIVRYIDSHNLQSTQTWKLEPPTIVVSVVMESSLNALNSYKQVVATFLIVSFGQVTVVVRLSLSIVKHSSKSV